MPQCQGSFPATSPGPIRKGRRTALPPSLETGVGQALSSPGPILPMLTLPPPSSPGTPDCCASFWLIALCRLRRMITVSKPRSVKGNTCWSPKRNSREWKTPSSGCQIETTPPKKILVVRKPISGSRHAACVPSVGSISAILGLYLLGTCARRPQVEVMQGQEGPTWEEKGCPSPRSNAGRAAKPGILRSPWIGGGRRDHYVPPGRGALIPPHLILVILRFPSFCFGGWSGSGEAFETQDLLGKERHRSSPLGQRVRKPALAVGRGERLPSTGGREAYLWWW